MRLYDILTHYAQREAREQRAEVYLDDAISFLGFAYDDDPWLAAAQPRRDFARACLDRSQALGIVRQREHLRYLSHSVLCGYAFEQNPLFRHELARAGWLDERGAATLAPDTEAFTPFANRWQGMGRVECDDPAVALDSCLRAIEAGGNLDMCRVARIVTEAWPDRSSVASDSAMDGFAEHVMQNVKRQRMPYDVSVIFAVLSLHLGAYFFHDARYVDLSRAFVNKGEDDATRSVAAAETIRRIWASEPSPSEDRHG
ncbi:hypothetical protein PE067_18930 [Paracoccus sp. DMF-8]|uniref:hypothetical protein n=1 Tax=Paracoccus sp. DMF-8 TaxID=3019445 RepID=UPI0023E38DF0|nr:hypothetical protein [Paracoccus sp. DMF-8]MDF3608019.1 hypothetical protein [Paracoccus sp. DMF-8]